MKKYITITALLAAGTAFANATEWKTTNADGSIRDDKAMVSGFLFNLSSDLLSTTPSEIDDTVRLDSIGIAWTTGASLGSEARYVLTDENNLILDVAKSNLTPVSRGTGKIEFNGVEISSDSVYRVWAAKTDKTYTVGETLGTVDILTGQNVAPGLKLGNSGAPVSSEGGLAILKDNNASLWNNWVPFVTIYTSSIPEPSAFGMLAGLGALALVASRRRRK